jgi:hypothetical protein
MIRKFEDWFEKKFLSFGETYSGINYKIKCDKEGSPDDEFFKQFSFYTKQKTTTEELQFECSYQILELF